jgi:hypothetical protein
MSTLREQAKAFLERPIPAELAPHHVSRSVADMMIAKYAVGNDLDEEALELVSLAAMESEAAAERYSMEDTKAYFIECGRILNGILETVC